MSSPLKPNPSFLRIPHKAITKDQNQPPPTQSPSIAVLACDTISPISKGESSKFGLSIRYSPVGHPYAFNSKTQERMTLPMAVPSKSNPHYNYDPLAGIKLSNKFIEEGFQKGLFGEQSSAAAVPDTCLARSAPPTPSPLARMLEEDRSRQAELLRRMGAE
jgi:hypothetical protein